MIYFIKVQGVFFTVLKIPNLLSTQPAQHTHRLCDNFVIEYQAVASVEIKFPPQTDFCDIL